MPKCPDKSCKERDAGCDYFQKIGLGWFCHLSDRKIDLPDHPDLGEKRVKSFAAEEAMALYEYETNGGY